MKKIFITMFLCSLFIIPIYNANATTLSHSAPYFGLSANLSSNQNTLTFTAQGDSGFFKEYCGPDEVFVIGSEGQFYSGYYGGDSIVDPYEMFSGSASAGTVSGSISSSEINQTGFGRSGTPCNASSRSIQYSFIDPGDPGSFTVTGSLNVSSLPAGTHTLSVTLCATSGICSTNTTSFTKTSTAPTASCSVWVSPSGNPSITFYTNANPNSCYVRNDNRPSSGNPSPAGSTFPASQPFSLTSGSTYLGGVMTPGSHQGSIYCTDTGTGLNSGWNDCYYSVSAPTAYTASSSHNAGGTVSPASTSTTGGPVSFSVTPNSGYSVSSYVPSSPTGCSDNSGGFNSTQSNYSTGRISANCNFDFNFSQTASPVNGQCSLPATHYTCSAGASSNNVNGASSYTWSCLGTGGGTTASCTEAKPAPTASISVSPPSVAYGEQTTLTWNSTNATSCTAYGPWTNSGTLSGSGWTGSLASTTTYQFQCTGNGQTSAMASATVTVSGAPINGICAGAHYNCAFGTSTTNTDGATAWTWSCLGSNGGTNSSCSETKAADLTASAPAQNTAAVNVAQPFSANISNIGNIATGATTFYNALQVASAADGGGTIIRSSTSPWTMSNLGAGSSATVSTSYTFASPGISSVRFCADDSPISTYRNKIAESNENNNCSAWVNVTVSAAAVNAVCDTTHYNCTAGTSATNAENPYNWTWACNGSGGGTNASCSESIPTPTNFVSACNAAGTSASLSWSLPAGYTMSYFRVSDTTTGQNLTNFWIPESVPDTGPATSFATTTGHNYSAWVHTRLPSGMYSNSVTSNFSCAAASDLTATAPTPSSATKDTALTFSSMAVNLGSVSTGASFSNFFQVASSSDGAGTITDLASSSTAALEGGTNRTITSPSYTFTAIGTRSVRMCADKTNSASAGVIAESNEGNNCSSWTNVVVSSSATCGNGVAEGSEQCDTGGSNGVCPSACSSSCTLNSCGVCLNGATNPPTCTIGVGTGPVTGSCSTKHYSCSTGTSTVNVNGTSAWTWTCAGSGGGSSASCSELKKKPIFIEN